MDDLQGRMIITTKTADTLAAEGMEPKGTIVLLTRLAKVVHRRSSEQLLGMSLRHYVALSTLRYLAPASQQQFCERLWLDPNNCVLLLNELEDAGYIARRRDPEDRRRHLVDITADGLDAIDRAEHAQESLEDEVLAALSPEERDDLRRLLLTALESPAAEAAAAAPAPSGDGS
jgi:DNA-binding MarR family transcriptional regulator